ncbi:MAG: site-specific integrase [Methylophaga sp.]|nr:site-specific integrase [Methylophaga sp.]
MNKKTKHDYLKLANHFLQARLTGKGIAVTPKNIKQALRGCATEYRPAYWRRLRCALVTQQDETGFNKGAEAIKVVSNPVTVASASKEMKAKQKRRKHVEKEEHVLLKRHLDAKGDRCLFATLELARILGCRPIEMMSLQLKANNSIFIEGAKKTENGLRGLDRTIILSQSDYDNVASSFLLLHEYQHTKGISKTTMMRRLQHRLATATKKLWPKRRHQITLYSYRHQMGSDLKASSMDREEVAAVMGHQSVDSVDVYGNKRRSSRNLSITATAESIVSVRKTQLKSTDYIKNKSTRNSQRSRVHNSTLTRL